MAEPTVGDARRAIAALTGTEPDSITHYVIAADTDEGVILNFCCDDRRHAAAMFAQAGRMVLAHRGESGRADGSVPAMPEDN